MIGFIGTLEILERKLLRHLNLNYHDCCAIVFIGTVEKTSRKMIPLFASLLQLKTNYPECLEKVMTFLINHVENIGHRIFSF